MAKYDEPVGKGGLWLNESKSGIKYMAGEITFSHSGHEVTCKIAVFKNTKKEGRQPDYNVIVNDAFPAKAKEPQAKKEGESDLPF